MAIGRGAKLAARLARESPAHWRIVESAGAFLGAEATVHEALAALGYTPDADGELRASTLAGRRALFELDARGERWLVRRFHHGGLARALTGDRFADPTRPFREAALAARLRSAGVATPDVLAARARPAPLSGWRLDLITRAEPGAHDLEAILAAAARGRVSRTALHALERTLGGEIARLHALGFLHADLTPKNVLLLAAEAWLATPCAAAPRLSFIDLDRSHFAPLPLADAPRRDNLRRLARYVLRRDGHPQRLFARSDYARVLRAAAPRTWREDWRAIARAHARDRRHAAGWLLEGRARWRDARPENEGSGSSRA